MVLGAGAYDTKSTHRPEAGSVALTPINASRQVPLATNVANKPQAREAEGAVLKQLPRKAAGRFEAVEVLSLPSEVACSSRQGVSRTLGFAEGEERNQYLAPAAAESKMITYGELWSEAAQGQPAAADLKA
mgnify:CR=1 FL=1